MIILYITILFYYATIIPLYYSIIILLDDQINTLQVFPNPAKDFIIFDYTGIKHIYNIFGVEVIKTTDNKINIAELPSGIYNISITDRSTRFIKK